MPANNNPYSELKGILNEFLQKLYANSEKVQLRNGNNEVYIMTDEVCDKAADLLVYLNQNYQAAGGKRRKNKKTRKQRK